VAFNSKLDNKTRRGKAEIQGKPATIDPVVFTNVSPAAGTADRVHGKQAPTILARHSQPTGVTLEKAGEMNLPKKVIGGIQMVTQLMGNANIHNSAAWRQALMTQLNSKLKQLLSGIDF